MNCICIRKCATKRIMGNRSSAIRRPKLVVFDLNYTLWLADITFHESKPFKKNSKGEVIDSRERVITYYRDVPEMLELLQREGYTMALASRYGWPEEERALLELLELEDYFTFKEIYVGDKTAHFKNLHQKSGVKYQDMLFFDDSQVNLRSVAQLGVVCAYVRRGMTFDVLREGLEKFAGLYPLASPIGRPANPVLRVQHLLKSYKVYNTYTKLNLK